MTEAISMVQIRTGTQALLLVDEKMAHKSWPTVGDLEPEVDIRTYTTIVHGKLIVVDGRIVVIGMFRSLVPDTLAMRTDLSSLYYLLV